MANYTNKLGDIFTQEDIDAAALENGVDIDTIISSNELKLKADEIDKDVDMGKEDGVVATDPPAAPKKKSGSPSKNTSSVSNGKKKYPWDPDNNNKGRGNQLANFKTGKETKEAVEKNIAKVIKKSPNKSQEEAFKILQAADSMDADISEIVYDDYNLEDLTFKTKGARKQLDVSNEKYKAQQKLDQETYRKDFEINNPDKIAPWAFEGDEEDVATKLAPVLESYGLEAVSSGFGNEITVQILDYENPKFGTVNESASFNLDEFKKDRAGFINKFNKQINLMKDVQYVNKVKNRAQGSFNSFQKQFGLDEDKRGFEEIENEINKERLKEFKGLKAKFGALLTKDYFKGDDKKYEDYVSYITKGVLVDKDIEDIAFYKYKDKLFDGRTLEQERKKYKEENATYSFPTAGKIDYKNPFKEQENPFDGFKEKAQDVLKQTNEVKEPSVFDLVENRAKNKAKDLDGKIQDFVSFELSRNKSANKLGNILTSDLRILQREYEKGLIKNSKDLKTKEAQYTADASNFEKELKAFKANSDKLMDQPLKTAEEVDALKLNYLDLLSKQEKLDKAKENLQISGLSLTKEANLAPVALTNFSKNYDRLSELATGFKELGTKLAIGGADLLKYQSRIGMASATPEFNKYSLDLLTGFEKEKQKLQTNLKVDEIKSFKDLGKWVAGSTAQTLPSLAMAFTGEFALPLFFLSGYGEATSKIALEKQEVIENIREAKNQILLLDPIKDQVKIEELNNVIKQEGSKINIGEGSEMAYKLLYGTSEAAFELVTIGLLKNLKAGIKQLPKQAIRNGFTGILKEGGSEFATTVSQNFGDIYIKGDSEKSLFEGGLESFAQGGLMGLGFSSAAGVGVLKRAVASELATRKDILQSRDLVKRVVELTGNKSFMIDQNISVDQLTENLHPKIKEEVVSLVNQIAEVDNNILDKLNYEYSADNLLEVGKINARIRQINKSVQEISADPNLSLAQVTELKKSYEKDFNELNEKRQEILSKGDGDVKTELAKQFNFSALEFYNDRVKLERNKVLFSLANQFNGLTEDEKADYELKAMAIKENDNAENLLYTGEDAPSAVELYVQDKAREILNKKRDIIKKFINDQGIKDEIDIITFDVTEDENLTQLIDRATSVYAEKNGYTNDSAQVKQFKEELKKGYIDGVILDDNKTIIEFVPNAAKNGRVSVLAHEIGHHEITKVFGNEKTGEAFLKFIEKNYPSSYIKIKARLDENENFIEGTETLNQDATQEPFTYFIDTLADNNAIPDKKVLAQIAEFLDSKQKVISFTNMLGQNEAAMFNYLIDFTNKTYFNKGGKRLSKNYIVGTDQDREASGITRASKTIEARMDKLDDQLANNEIGFEQYEAEMKKLEQEEFEQSKKTYEEEKKVVKKETTKKDTAKKEPSEISEVAAKAKAKLDAIGNDPKGFNPNNPAIYDELDKMVKVKSRNYKTSNGTIIDLTNKNKGGLDGFSMEEMTSYVTMSMLPYIQKFDPSKNDSLYGYINAQLANRMKGALKSGQVADVVFTEDVTEMTKLSNEEVEVKSKSLPEVKKFQNILESGVFSPDVIENIRTKLLPILRTLKSKVNEKTTLNKTVAPIINEIRNEIGKQADIDIKKAMGGKEDQVFQNFLITNKKTILENLTTTWLMGKDNGKTVSGGMPFAVQKRVNGQWLSYPDWIGKKTDREAVTTDLAGRTSGAELVRRLPEVNKNVSTEEFLSALIDLKNGDIIRGRKESLAKAMSEELAFDLISDDMANQGLLYQALERNQEILGAELDKLTVQNFDRLIERGNIKRSQTKEVKKLYTLFNQLGKDVNNTKLIRAVNYQLNKFKDEEDFKILRGLIENKINTIKGLQWRAYEVMQAAFIRKQLGTGINSNFTVRTKGGTNAYIADIAINLKKSLLRIYVEAKKAADADIPLGSFMANSFEDKILNGAFEKFNLSKNSKAFIEKFKNQKQGLYNFIGKGIGEKTRAGYIKLTNEQIAELKSKKNIGNRYIVGYTNVPIDMLKAINDIKSQPTDIITIRNTVFDFFKGYDGVDSFESVFKNIENLPNDLMDKLFSIKTEYQITTENTVQIRNYINFNENIELTNGESINAIELINNYTRNEKNKNIEQLNTKTIQGIFDVKSKLATTKSLDNALLPQRKSKTISTVSDFINSKNLKRIDAETSFDVLNDLNKEIENYWGIVPNDVIVKMNRAVDYAFDVIEDRENEGGPLMAAVNDALNLETVKFAEKQLNEFIENNRPKGQQGITKFSLTSKRDLKWDIQDDGSLTYFNVNNKEYSIFLRDTGIFNYSIEEQKILNNLIKKYNLEEEEANLLGSYEGGTLNLGFSDENGDIEITGAKNAFEVFGVVINGVLDYIKNNGTEGLVFTAKEPSRRKLYNAMAETYADKLGWNAFYEDGVYIISKYPKKIRSNNSIDNNNLKGPMYSKSSGDYTTVYAGAPIGKNLKEIGRKGVNFFATDKREADEYARMNDGVTQEFVINKNDIVNEDVVFDKIKELGLEPVSNKYTVDEQMLYELIDPRFEGAISSNDITTLFNALRKDGVKAISYTDGAQVTGNTTKSIAVIDTSVLDNQTNTKFSKTLDFEFNDILERNTGVEAFAKVSDVVAKRTGIKKNKLSFFVPPSADDFRGLTTYMFAGKGKQGELDQEFFDKNLTVPYVKGINTLDSVRQSIRKEYKMLLNNFPDIKKKLEKLTPDKGFTYDQAVRVYLWSNSGKEIPGLSRLDKNKLLYFVKQNPDLVAFANALSITGRQDGGWIDPSTTWDSETIISDLHNITEGAGRKKYLEEFIENADAIFTKENLNKIQSIYGTNVREALEDSLYRMKNGKNRPEGTDRVTNTWMNWINGSTAAIMFFNTRSALLQTISAMNFLNWNDNNPYMAGKAFLNQKQYWSDFAMIINSDKLKERRSGLKADVTQAEIANAANSAKNKFHGVISYLQKIGFTPTQAADSFSIAVSGATFYRNRVNTYLKAGNTQQEAEEKAFNDFSIITDQSMQSADPMYVSKQQTTALGRIILAFGNTPMQYNRLIKKAASDLVNKRGDWKTNISKIVYYGALQNMLFSFLQSALFIPLGYDDDEEPDFSKMTKEEKKAYEKLQKKYEDKVTNMLNGMADTLLRGSGVYGAAIATIKNTVMEYFKQEEKEMFADHAYTVLALTSVSPPISSKARKLYGAIRISKFEKDVIAERGWEVTRDGKLNLSPNYRIAGNIAVATTNLPLDRVVEKINNISEVMDSRNTKLQRTALALGWKDWELNVKNEENETIKATAKVKRKEEGIEKAIQTRAENKILEKERYRAMSFGEKSAYRKKIKEEKRQQKFLKRKRKRKMG